MEAQGAKEADASCRVRPQGVVNLNRTQQDSCLGNPHPYSSAPLSSKHVPPPPALQRDIMIAHRKSASR